MIARRLWRQLRIGEHLHQADGTLTQVTRITPRRGPPVPVFNFEMDVEHVYHVGAGGVLVRNQYHRYWPRWLGITVPYGNKRILTDLPEPEHRALHTALKEWLKKHNPSIVHGPGYGKDIIATKHDWVERVTALEKFYENYQDGKHLGNFYTEVLLALFDGRFH